MDNELIFANPVEVNGIVKYFKLRCGNKEKLVDAEQVVEVLKAGRATIANLEVTDNGLCWYPPRDIMDKIEKDKLKHKMNEIILKNSEYVNSATTKTTEEKPVVPENKPTTSEVKADTPVPRKSDQARIKELVEKLNEARKVYEQGTDEIMSNFEYDKLYDELVELEKKTGIIFPNSPTQNVGYEIISSLEKYSHESPMLSLEKTKDREELIRFLCGKEGVLSWKLDGLTIVLTYDNGKLIRAVTRGDGNVGEIVTENVKQFKNVPTEIPFKGKLVIRGEATIDYATFKAINESLPAGVEKYKNPRNLCSGTVRQLNTKVTAERNVKLYGFELVSAEGVTIPKNFDEQLKILKSYGIDTVEYIIVSPNMTDRNFILLAVEQFEKIVQNYNVPTDGLVLTFRDREYGMSLGRIAKAYRHSIAFKWKDAEEETHLQDIEWQVGRTGIITPVAIYDPVDLEGSTVSRASLHNISIIDSILGLPYIGQKIRVFKSNMIIPQLSWGDKPKDGEAHQYLYPPDECPCCDAPTVVKIDKESGVATLHCTNPDCLAKGNRKLEHFVKRDCMNIDGISGATLEALVDAGIVTDFVSIYHIDEYEDDIVELEGFGYTKFNNMVAAINKSRHVKLANLIFALGIPNVGLNTSILICDNFDNDLTRTVTATYDQLYEIEGIGDVIAESFTNYFADADNAQQFIDLVQELTIEKPEAKINNSMAGVTICVTGDVYIFKNRREVENLIVKLGGKLAKSVTGRTNYLVTNDGTTMTNKLKSALEYKTPILSEQEFIDKFNLQQYI